MHDEAFTYLAFLQGSWHTLYFEFNANNHVLSSILTKLSIGIFGLSEFSLRLVSVLAGFFLMLGIYQVLQVAKTPVAIRWAALLAIGAHPLLMDFSVAARGYSLALACLVWAIAFSMRGSTVLTGLMLGWEFRRTWWWLFQHRLAYFAIGFLPRVDGQEESWRQ